MNKNVGIMAAIVASVGLGGGSIAISWVWAQQAPEAAAHENNHRQHAEEETHDDHAAPDHDSNDSIVQLSREERKRFGIEVAVASSGGLTTRISLPGEIVLNADRVAHIVPRAPGIVLEVLKNVGDTVRAGEVMAWLESAELGEAKVDYISKWATLSFGGVDLSRAQEVYDNTVEFLEILGSAQSLESLRDVSGNAMGENRSILVSAYAEFVYSKAAYEREKPLFEKKVASERDLQAAEAEYKKAEAMNIATRDSIAFKVRRDLLDAKRAQQVREIELKGARRRLYVFGLTSKELTELQTQTQLDQPKEAQDTRLSEERLAWYPLRAPFDGRVIEKHLTLGEKHSNDAGAFTVADLNSVWVDIAVYQKDLAYVKQGLGVEISVGAAMPTASGFIAYISPVVDEKTRTALARVVLPNSSGNWRPGLFVSGEISIGHENGAIVVRKSAVQRMGEEPVVFLDTAEGFRPIPVKLGRGNASHIEILSGLEAGERYVTHGGFELKAKIVTSGLDAHAGHGH
jgi:RND family efflux transporter MFP subunit